jgi:hypothetical protein
MHNKDYVLPGVRVGILLIAVLVAFFISSNLTGSIFPQDPFENLIFQGALLMVVFGSTVQEYLFTSPSESLINSFIGMITLIPVFNISSKPFWWIIFGYCFIIFLLGILSTGLSYSKDIDKSSRKFLDLIYHPVINLGRARIIFSILFIFGLFSFYELRSREFVILLLFWGLFIVIWPLGIPSFISNLFEKNLRKSTIGQIIRTDWPNLLHVEIHNDVIWRIESPKVFQEADGTQSLAIPLYKQHQGDSIIGTGIYVKSPLERLEGLERGSIYELPDNISIPKSDIYKTLGCDDSSTLIGFVSSDSRISEIKFEVTNVEKCYEGKLIWCSVSGERVFYQIMQGTTNEEQFENNRYGYQTGFARQLGKLTQSGFETYDWLPYINSPVFAVDENFGENLNIFNPAEDFSIGIIPGTKLKMGGNFIDNMDYHTAILGVTGSGKTELALDLIRHVSSKGFKVICIDLTMKYSNALNELNPVNLTLSEEELTELDRLLFKLDIGTFSKTEEKKELKTFVDKSRTDITNRFKSFLEAQDTNLGIVSLKELSNTQATLYITEIYLTELLNYAKHHPEMKKTLVVVEEAHTVMPEPTTMGLGDFDSKGLVGKIAQLSLQGRKYKIGLLVISQRTATVSKSILTQCNTIFSFKCFDDTSLGFMKNVVGSNYVDSIPDLQKLHLLAYGKAIKSENPVIIQIPFDQAKVNNNN